MAVTGDGGFGQYAMELTTAVKYGIPVKHVLLNNNALGKISKEQLAADYPVWHTSLHNPDWAAYAELCGATGPQGHPPRPARRRDGRAVRHRRTGPALHRAGRRAPLTPTSRTTATSMTQGDTMTERPRLHAASRPPSSTAPSSVSPEPSHTQGLVDASAGTSCASTASRSSVVRAHRPRHRHRRLARHARARLGDRRLAGALPRHHGQPTSSWWPARSGSATTAQRHQAGASSGSTRCSGELNEARASTSSTAGSPAA